MPLTSFKPTTDTGILVEALRRDGAVVVSGLIEPGSVDAIRAELRPQFDVRDLETASDFDGSLTLRCSPGLLSHAPGVAALIDHDMVVAIADAMLLPYCATYQVGSMTAIEILPGESAQATTTVWPSISWVSDCSCNRSYNSCCAGVSG